MMQMRFAFTVYAPSLNSTFSDETYNNMKDTETDCNVSKTPREQLKERPRANQSRYTLTITDQVTTAEKTVSGEEWGEPCLIRGRAGVMMRWSKYFGKVTLASKATATVYLLSKSSTSWSAVINYIIVDTSFWRSVNILLKIQGK
jgi:hypothetical protein